MATLDIKSNSYKEQQWGIFDNDLTIDQAIY
jgi:hypothetical protein